MNNQLKLFNYNFSNEEINNLNGFDKLIYIHITNMIKNQNYTFQEALRYTVNFYSDKQSRFRIKSNIIKVFNTQLEDLKTYTYLMFDGKYYKIGKSKDPEKRLKQLQTGNVDIKLISYYLGDIEKITHQEFWNKRIKDEWFDFSNSEDFDFLIAFMSRNSVSTCYYDLYTSI